MFEGPRGSEDAPRPVRRPQPVDRLPLHVRAGGRRWLPALLVLGRQLRRERRAPRRPRDDARRDLARTGREARGVPPAHGLGLPLGLVRRQRLQLATSASRSPPDERESRVYNYGSQAPGLADREGVSVFVRDDEGAVFHTYSAYARGIDLLNSAYNYIDLTPEGRGRGRAAAAVLGAAPRRVCKLIAVST